MEIVLCWSQSDEKLDSARLALCNAMRDLGLLPHWREQGACPPEDHLQLRVNGRVAANLHSSAGLRAALRSGLERPSAWHRLAGARALILAAAYLLLPKCALCWTAWLAVLGLAGSVWSPYSLNAAAAVMATASTGAALVPFCLFLRARRFQPAAALFLGTAAVLLSRFSGDTWFVSGAGLLSLTYATVVFVKTKGKLRWQNGRSSR